MDPIYKMAIIYDMPIYVRPTIRDKLLGGERYNLFRTLTRKYDTAKVWIKKVA